MLDSPYSASEHQRISQTVQSLGMVQLDSIGVLARAHDHILWSRHNSYRKADFYRLYSNQPAVFEHFTHDASILPVSSYPYWRGQLQKKSERYRKAVWGKHIACAKTRQKIMEQIERRGAMCSQDFTRQTKEKANKNVHAWMRTPHKLALDYLWLAGQLSVSHRQGFIKFYDLTSRVIPKKQLSQNISGEEQTNWACLTALQRLGFATVNEIQGFFDALTLEEVRQWLTSNQHLVQAVTLDSAAGMSCTAYALKDVESRLKSLPKTSGRLRIVNPFDPIVRDRKRLKSLFGYDYKIEIYVPASKRRYGYYVCPMLEGERFIGRIEVRADKERDSLHIRGWWLEEGIRQSSGRTQRLLAELNRLARLVEVSTVDPLPKLSVR